MTYAPNLTLLNAVSISATTETDILRAASGSTFRLAWINFANATGASATVKWGITPDAAGAVTAKYWIQEGLVVANGATGGWEANSSGLWLTIQSGQGLVAYSDTANVRVQAFGVGKRA